MNYLMFINLRYASIFFSNFRDTVVVTCVTLLTVLMVGCVTFSTIGHLAKKTRRPFWTVLSDGMISANNKYLFGSV